MMNCFKGYTNGFTSYPLGFSLYISNTTDRLEGVRCFHESKYTIHTIPDHMSIYCPHSGQYVIYYNERIQESLIRLVIPLTLTQTCVKYRFMVIYQLKLQFNFTKIHETLSIYAKSDIRIIINNIIILLYYLFRLSQSCRRSFSMLKTMSFKL